MNVAAHQKGKNEKTKTGKRKAGEDRQPILKLRAAILWSFRGQHGKKWFERGEFPGNWDPKEG